MNFRFHNGTTVYFTLYNFILANMLENMIKFKYLFYLEGTN